MSTSLKRLLPAPAENPDDSDYWDFSSVAAITRAILECCILFYYLGVEEVPEGEWQDRLNLIHLHDCTARISLFRNLLNDDAQAVEFEQIRDDLLARFENSAFLLAKPERQRAHLLRGDKVMFVIQDEVLASMGIDRQPFRTWYEVLSSHVHSYPLAFHRMLFDGRGNGVENNTEKGWSAATMRYLQGFLANAVTQMLGLFPDVKDPRLANI